MSSNSELPQEVTSSPLYSPDLAPIPPEKRTWGLWDMAAIWVGMAVCIPTYLLASYMIKSGLSWVEALIIIALGNLIITIPMALNGHAGVKYGIPFPVIGRAAFGTKGIHIAAVVRGIVACGWFGIQTWIGGLAFYAIWHAINGTEPSLELDAGKFVGFFLFWLMNVFFIWRGTESIKWLEKFAAPILIGIGIALIVWGASVAGGFGVVLQQSEQLGTPSGEIFESDEGTLDLHLHPTKDAEGNLKADAYRVLIDGESDQWKVFSIDPRVTHVEDLGPDIQKEDVQNGTTSIAVQFKTDDSDGVEIFSSEVPAVFNDGEKQTFLSKIWSYLLWLTAMVGFWATMAISIADITRFTATQRNQVRGQFIGLPGTMALFSFVGIFVTCAAVINFQDVLASEDAPWDPVTLLGKFSNPAVVIFAQVFMLIATLSTNIAANVIAPANAFSNLNPSRISFRKGGYITAIIGIIIAPWWLLNQISGLLIFVSGFLGPVLGILIADYFLVRKRKLSVNQLFIVDGKYSFGGSGYNSAAMFALVAGVLVALIGLWVESVSFLYTLSWFTGFFVAFVLYYFLMLGQRV